MEMRTHWLFPIREFSPPEKFQINDEYFTEK